MQKHEDKPQVARIIPEPSPDRRESVAAVLRRAREKHGQDVRSVAQVLRIRQAYLEALEAGAFDKLPGSAYAIGFLRTYAEYLGLNANNIIDRFKEEVQGPERRTELVFPEPVAEGRIPGGAIILISVSLLAVAYGGWFYLSNQGRSVADLIPALPEQIQTLIDGQESDPAQGVPASPAVVAQRPAVPEAPVIAAEPASEPAVPETPVETAETPAEAAAPVIAPRKPTPPPQAPVQAAAPEPAAEVESEPAPEPMAASESEPAPEPSVTLTAPEPPAAQAETFTAPEEAAPDSAPEPPEGTQFAVLPETDTAGDAYTGPPLDPGPAPELEVMIREEVRDQGADTVQDEPAQREPIRSEPVQTAQRTLVIPAPAAPRDFAMSGERTPQVYGESNRNARIVVRAIQDSWVQVRDRQDALLLTRVLRSGDIYRVPDQDGLTLLTGNAGGIELAVDGVTLPPLGPVGAVRRQIALDPASLLSARSQ